MEFHEPMTLLTDYALGLLSGILAIRMANRGIEATRVYWTAALAASAAAAILGGTYHGFLPWLPSLSSNVLWKATLWSIGCASYCVVIATIRIHLVAQWQKVFQAAAFVKLALFTVIIFWEDAFLIAIIDYSIAFGLALVLHWKAWIRKQNQAARWITCGILVSFSGAGIQALGLAPHQNFNHNDLYHVIQMIGTWMLYRGASQTRLPEYSTHPSNMHVL